MIRFLINKNVGKYNPDLRRKHIDTKNPAGKGRIYIFKIGVKIKTYT